MDIETAERWLGELAAEHPLESFTAHGGEPFLHLDLLRGLIRRARSLGIPGRGVITNSYWAESPSKARAILRDLKEEGLNRITFSVDAFHQEFIPMKRVQTAIRAALSLEWDRIWVDSYWVDPGNPVNSWDRATSEALNACSDLEGVECAEFQAMVEGRAADHLLPLLNPLPEVPKGMCSLPRWIGGDLERPEGIELDPRGNVTLCPGVCIGNAETRSLTEILDRYTVTDHPILGVIAEKGPVGLLRLARSKGYKEKKNFVNECHLCYEMRCFLRPHYPGQLAPQSVYVEGNAIA
jgi:hypothetical protein